jgi:acid stress chaperone HdeB
MKRIFGLFGLLVAVAATPASSQVLIDMSQVTCKEFAGYDDDTKALVAAWMGGYFSAGRNLNIVQSVYIERNFKKVGEYCKKHKKDGLLTVVEKVGH